MELVSTLPIGPIALATQDEPHVMFVQDILVLKLMRIYRVTSQSTFEQVIKSQLIAIISKEDTRSEKISSEKQLNAFWTVLKLVSQTIVAIYLQGLIWYRFS
jgi:hypothetical protein